MLIADLFCGAGGSAMGLHQAFPHAEIHGYDIVEQPRYPFHFHRQDALTVDLSDYDFVWASPPCQAYIRGGLQNMAKTSDLVRPTRRVLEAWHGPWIIENVPGAPLKDGALLCGSMFGLPIRRHRIFEASFPLPILGPVCDHSRPIIGVYGHPHGGGGAWKSMLPGSLSSWSGAMEIGWMATGELSQAIPPAYSRYLAQFIPVAAEHAA